MRADGGTALTHRRRLLHAVTLVPAVLARPARAQARYPDRPIRIVVPFPAGGGTDTMARMLIDAGFQATLDVPVVVDNRSGGGTMIGSEHVAKSQPDGHTLLFTITTLVQAPIALRQFPCRPIEDFTWIGRLGTAAITFTIGPAVPPSVTTLAEFVAWGQGRPLAFGNYSSGSTPHAFAVMLAQEMKLNVTQVSYRGEAPMLQDLLGGQFHGGFHSTIVAGEMMRAGRVRPLATGGLDRVPSLADRVPTLRELGYSRRCYFAACGLGGGHAGGGGRPVKPLRPLPLAPGRGRAPSASSSRTRHWCRSAAPAAMLSQR